MYMYRGKEEELHRAVQQVSFGKDLELDDKLLEMSKSTEDLAKIINQRNLARSTQSALNIRKEASSPHPSIEVQALGDSVALSAMSLSNSRLVAKSHE